MNRIVKRSFIVLLAVLLMLVLLGFGFGPSILGRAMNGLVENVPPPPSEEAVQLHATLAVVDLHGDALLWKRDLIERGDWGHIDLPRMREGRIAVQAFTTVTKTPRGMNIESNAGDSDMITLAAVLERWPMATWRSLTERALYQADKLRSTAARSRATHDGDGDGHDEVPELVVLESRADLQAFLEHRDTGANVVAGFLGIEGAHALEGELDNVDRLFEAGFRMFGLTHFFDNAVGGSAHGVDKGGLTAFGEAVLLRMEHLGILVDVAHASEALIADVMARATRPVVVSHGGVRGTCDNQRNLSDGQLEAIAATGGVMGVGLWETAVCGTTPAAWARAVRHATDVMGVDHVALGSDWDGAVTAIVDSAGTVHLVQALIDEGFTHDEIRKIMGLNTLRVLSETLP